MTEAVQRLKALIHEFAGIDVPPKKTAQAGQPATWIEPYQTRLNGVEFDAIQIAKGHVMSTLGAVDDIVGYAQHLDDQNDDEDRIFIFSSQADPGRALVCVFGESNTLVLRIPKEHIAQVMEAGQGSRPEN